MNRCVALSVLAVLAFGAPASGRDLPSPVPGLQYRLDKVAEGIYCAVASGVPYIIANAVVIVGDDAAAVVDPGVGPDEARVLLTAIGTVTDRPVRYVIDTHFHFDHAFGSEAFEGAIVIGHDATRGMLGADALRRRTAAGFVAGLPAQIDKARADAARERDAMKRAELERAAAALEAYRKQMADLRLIPPTLTFDDRLTLWLGAREVRLLHLGRGHTAGDIVVFLPRERVLCSGDLFNGYIGYMGDAYVDEWAATLGRLAALVFDTVIPGHGTPFKGKGAIAPVQACLRDIWRQAEALKRAGVPADEAAGRIDLRVHAERFPRFSQIGFEPLAVRRIYEVIDERAAGPAVR
jgi:cyclase